MNFAFFLILNAVLLIRPEEIIPDIAGIRLYLTSIIICSIATCPQIIAQLRPTELKNRPITICVLGLLVAGILSHLARSRSELAIDFVGDFIKVVLYYLILVGVISTPARMHNFIKFIIPLVMVLTTIGILSFHGYIQVEALAPLTRNDVYDPETGKALTFYQLRSSGIYNDPNDLCMILTTAIICCLAISTTSDILITKITWLMPVALFGYAIVLTGSRGGLLALLAALFALACLRLGPRRGGVLALICLPALLLLVGGRQANLNIGGNDTAQERMRLWVDGLELMKSFPLLGIGVDEYAKEFDLVAHNSFIQGYVETGLFGGSIFLAAFLLSAIGILMLPRYPEFLSRDDRFRTLRPFVFAIVVGYATGAFSLSRNFVIPTYMIFGLAASYIKLSFTHTPLEYQMTKRLAGQLAVLGVLGIVFLKFFTQYMVNFGG